MSICQRVDTWWGQGICHGPQFLNYSGPSRNPGDISFPSSVLLCTVANDIDTNLGMIKVEARSPSPGQLAHTLAPPGRLRPIHPISDSSFRAVSAAEGPSDATLAALLDAAYKENHSLREEIRHREERERRILGLLLQYEQAVQKSGKEATTARIGGGTPSSGW